MNVSEDFFDLSCNSVEGISFPHSGQNLELSAISFPHLEQNITSFLFFNFSN
jgi:hypothetical protein